MLFINNKYTKWYTNIITNAHSRTRSQDDYVERHHIIPKSLGGSNRQENLVRLTAKEHFVVHHLLTKMVTGIALQKMACAFHKMMFSHSPTQCRYLPPSKAFERMRKSAATKGELHHNHGRKHTEEWRANRSEVYKGEGNPNFGKRHKIENWGGDNSGENNPMHGKSHSLSAKEKISENAKNRQKFKCPHCDKEVDSSNYSRWHGENCRTKP